MAASQAVQAAYGVEQFGQQACDGLGGAALEQYGRLGVAPVGAHPGDEPDGEAGAPVGDDGPQQAAACGAGQVVQGLFVRLVRYAEAAGDPQGVPLHEGVGVGEVRADPLRVAADGRGDDGRPALVRPAGVQFVQHGAQISRSGQRACTGREFTHAPRVRKRIEGLRQGVGHGPIVPCGVRPPRAGGDRTLCR